MPIKKTPDISGVRDAVCGVRDAVCGVRDEVCGDAAESNVGAQNLEPTENKEENLTVLQSYDLTVSKSSPDNFPDHWHAMFNHVFSSVPTIYIPLKESLPEIENNIIKVTVKNEIQKEHFEAKTREVLEFLRTHFDEKIEDVVVETNEKLETKKIIYDIKEKLQNFKEQNAEIEDFIQVLELKIKD
jgi:hypothetical protein